MKNWSLKGDPADVEALLTPLAEILRNAYQHKSGWRKQITYRSIGFQPYRVFGDGIQPDERFKDAFRDDGFENPNFDLIASVLVVAFQYGIEQGKRIDKVSAKQGSANKEGALSGAHSINQLIERVF